MKKCLVCESAIEPFMSFGKQPIANGFLSQSEFGKEYFFEMQVAFCAKCTMFQLVEQPNPEQMFNDTYAFFSGTSSHMTTHFKLFAESVIEGYLKAPDPFVVEIGSNDGIMLKNFKEKGIRHLGVEPSGNVARVAASKGINTISKFFDANLARQIVQENGQADAFMAANVMCHIPYIHSVLDGIDVLLKPNGVVVFEDPYLADVVEQTSYDQIYDEHVFLFSVSSISHLFEMHGMEVVDIAPQKTHGGSMRYTIMRKGKRPKSVAVTEQLAKERDLGLHDPKTYLQFKANCERSRSQLKSLLSELRQMGKRVVGYAATSKSTTILNYCQIGSELVEFISDTTPIKQGKFSPGMHIPVHPYVNFKSNYPEYALLFAYNHYEEIMAKEEEFKNSGGNWIMYIPETRVLS